ncbi:PIG-L deacetylase family protein [Hahella ganghwensis]|uniref:PIG-L deacetylase family protein n=1 Tax=Hahella ganghwensis TaxID=286420 RepID=UPI00037D362C|nr:PIG-L family deacetylase [Hahella ganghwensis]
MNRILILSPHPDDTVWSLGGLMHELSDRYEVVVVSLFDGDPETTAVELLNADSEHKWRQFTDAKFRRTEDAKAVRALNARLFSLEYPDAALRCSDDRFVYPSLDDLMIDISQLPNIPVPEDLKNHLAMQIDPSDIVIAPLGIGGHIDHLITLQLARSLDNPIAFYPEFPYALDLTASDISRYCSDLGLKVEPQSVHCSWSAWQAAASLYRSQVIRLFAGRQPFSDSLSRFAAQQGDTACCRIWCTASVNFATEPSSANSAGSA